MKLPVIKRSLFIGVALVFITVGTTVCQQRIGNYKRDFSHTGNTISLVADDALVRLDFCTPKMFRVRVIWDNKLLENERWMVTKYKWAPVEIQTASFSNYFQLKTASLKIIIHKAPVSIDVYTEEGKLLSSESNTAGSDNGCFKQGDEVMCKKMMQPDEHFFGFGERMDFLDRRGKRVILNVGRGRARNPLMGPFNILKANYSPIPFFMSTRGYGIFFHNSYETAWDMGAVYSNVYSFKAMNGVLDYYFIYGPDFTDILNDYTNLTGKSPLLPKFAMGLHVGTYSGGTWGHEGQVSPGYVLELVRKFREMGIPIDILFLDSTWRIFASGGHGATTFEWRPSFTDPKKMFDSLYAMHLHAVGLHIRPRLDNGPHYHLLDAAQKAGITYPVDGKPGVFPNYFDTTAVNWWWNHAAMKVASAGAMFFKTDEGSAFRPPMSSPAGRKGLHNIFPLAYTSAAFNKFKIHNGIRGMNQTREGYAGIQRYPYIFAGDWPSQWQMFEPVIKAGLNIGISGVGYWTHCMGGFGVKADPELYIRWCQFGMFSPVAMLFGTDHPGYKEPWNYGEKALLNFKKYDSLRYTLIPYLYSTAYQLYKTGVPIIRALVLDYQDDYNVYDIADQYMLGDNMMICPVTQSGARSRIVYLPEGEWYNYWTGQQYKGKQYITVLSPLLQLPIFIKGGGIIPMQPVMQYVGQRSVDTVTLDIYPGDHSSFNLYDDDGLSMKYQQGDYAITRVSCRRVKNLIQIKIARPRGKYKVKERHYQLKIHTDRMPSSVMEDEKILSEASDNKTCGWYYNQETKVLWICPDKTSSNNINIDVKGKSGLSGK